MKRRRLSKITKILAAAGIAASTIFGGLKAGKAIKQYSERARAVAAMQRELQKKRAARYAERKQRYALEFSRAGLNMHSAYWATLRMYLPKLLDIKTAKQIDSFCKKINAAPEAVVGILLAEHLGKRIVDIVGEPKPPRETIFGYDEREVAEWEHATEQLRKLAEIERMLTDSKTKMPKALQKLVETIANNPELLRMHEKMLRYYSTYEIPRVAPVKPAAPVNIRRLPKNKRKN